MLYRIKTRWAANTKSRSAYYQTFWIEAAHGGTSEVVAFIHYGKLGEPEVGKLMRPVLGGTLKPVKPVSAVLSAPDRVKLELVFNSKCRDGDYVEYTNDEGDQTFTEGGFRDRLTQLFGAQRRDEILIQLDMRPGANPSAAPETDVPPPKPAVEHSIFDAIDAEIESDKGRRGSW